MNDIIDQWTQAHIPLPRVTLSYIITPIDGDPSRWRMVRGGQGVAYVVEDTDVRFELFFAHGLTAEQRAHVIASFQRLVGEQSEQEG